MALITPRTGNIFLRTGQGVIATPAGGGLVVIPGGGGGGGVWLQATLASLAGAGSGLASVSYLMRFRVDEVLAYLAGSNPNGFNGCLAVIGAAFELGLGNAGSGLWTLISTSYSGFVNGGPTGSGTTYANSLFPKLGSFIWSYAFADTTVSAGAMGQFIFTDSGTQLGGGTLTGQGTSLIAPTTTVALNEYNNSPFVLPGGLVVDGIAIFGSAIGSAQLSGAARYTPPIPYGVGGSPANLLASWGFSQVLTPDQPGLVAPFVPTVIGGAPASVSFLPGGIFN